MSAASQSTFWRISSLRAVLLFLICLIAVNASAVVKERYGGTLRIAEELLTDVGRLELQITSETNSTAIELPPLQQQQIVEINSHLDSIKSPSHSCHWLLDYPYFNHTHTTTISLAGNQLIIESSEPDFTEIVAKSDCLLRDVTSVQAFRKTQFGFEANAEALMGRPFLDALSPVPVDPANPYLSFKLNELDVVQVPEDRYKELSKDPSLQILPGPKFFVYLKTRGISSQQIAQIVSVINVQELSLAVLNGHAEVLLSGSKSIDSLTPSRTPIFFHIPQQEPYRLIAERIKFDMQDAGFTFTGTVPAGQAPLIEFSVHPVNEQDYDLFRYRLMREVWKTESLTSWYEKWDQMESAGIIVPLMVHQTYIAARKSIIGLKPKENGLPDFANCWMNQQ